MHTDGHVESTQLRLSLDLGISNQQPAEGIGMATDLQMPGKYCQKNSQQRRGRRRRGAAESAKWQAAGGFSGIFCWSINLAILIWLAHCTNAVPTDSSSSSSSSSNSNSASSTIVMAVVTPSSISSSGSSTTESLLEQQQPQGQCLLDGIWVPETTVHCEKQTSCRAIQRTGHCCPDYKCDCQKDGKTYANGYKLVDPDTPCTVCYCKGGAIVCSPVTCFRRDDCMPKYVPGRCCPEYDNCPILDNNPPLSSESSSAAPSTAKPAPAAPPAGFNWNITIKEITKPTEIRITDDNHKVKQTIPTRKAPNTEAPSAATSTATTAATPTAAAAAVADSTTAATDMPASEATTAAGAAAVSSTAATPTAATDSPATPTLSQDTNPKALPVNGSESLKLIASVGYIEHPLPHNTHIGGAQQPKPLVTYNSDGLQPLAENDPSKVNIKREYTTEGVAGLYSTRAEAVPIGAGSLLLQNGFRDALVDNVASAAELEPDTAGSDNIYHIISTTEGPSSSSSSSSSSTERPSMSSTEGPMQSTEYSSTYVSNVTMELESTTEGMIAVSSTSSTSSSSSISEQPSSTTAHHMEEEDVPQVESNPAYPSLPEDDFSLRDVNFPLVELEEIVEAESKDEQRSIVSAFERDNKRIKLVTENSLDASGNGSGAGSGGGSGDPEFYLGSTTEHMLSEASSLGKVSIQQVPLMYSAEDSSAETRIQNVNELAKLSARQTENETSGELDTGSGNGELREPTTPRAQRLPAVDIDELGSGAGQAQGATAQDPKADAESLKLDESLEQADNVIKTKAAARGEKSFVEQSATAAAQHLERLYLQRIY
ncbi:flocculation protein FLO11 [Drosophila hydei]|uniref:Flocculation protein FLO11 n=1 Tax=Drosophila hydei TaxID=7224 RepID=A0A6J2SRE0_DROHY|nr:flocculation protein FLO11 [Drosophila hydei]XP_030080293.1 flocculation protein FLO11 [Drosophila hydei]